MKLLQFYIKCLYINSHNPNKINTLIDFKLNDHRHYGDYIINDDNKLIRNGEKYYYYKENKLTKIIAEEDDERDPNCFCIYRYDFEYFSKEKVLRKKILLERNNKYHDQLLNDSKNKKNLQNLHYYLQLTPSVEFDIVDTVILTNFNELYKPPEFVFNRAYKHEWIYPNIKDTVVHCTDETMVTKEIHTTDCGSYIKLKKYKFIISNNEWRLNCQKYYIQNSLINGPETHWYDECRNINKDWHKSDLMNSFSDDFILYGTELYYYNNDGTFNYLENDTIQLIIINTLLKNGEIEEGIIIRKEPEGYDTKTEKWFTLLKKEDEQIENLFLN